MSASVTALVVTYNRKDLLQLCLEALANQTRRPDRILVVDNASTDGTREFLVDAGWTSTPNFELHALAENTGGAGGFAAGLQRAFACGADWAWIMDDDAAPYVDALAQLMAVSPDPGKLYGSVAICGEWMSWPMQPAGAGRHGAIDDPRLLPAQLSVGFIPFLGLLVSCQVVERIGLPDASFFIAKDDVEYAYRAARADVQSVLVAGSRIEHPASQYHRLRVAGIRFQTLDIPAWKRYYSVRNRILIARRHLGMALYYATLPGSVLHLALALLYGTDRRRQFLAWFGGTLDGLRGLTGRRHKLWGLGQP